MKEIIAAAMRICGKHGLPPSVLRVVKNLLRREVLIFFHYEAFTEATKQVKAISDDLRHSFAAQRKTQNPAPVSAELIADIKHILMSA